VTWILFTIFVQNYIYSIIWKCPDFSKSSAKKSLSLDLLRLLSLDLDRVLFLFLVSGDDFLLLVGETLRYEPPLRLVLEFDRDRDRPRGDRDLPRGDRDRRDRDREREGEFLRRSRDLVRRFSLSFVSFVVAVVAFSSSFMTFFSVGGIFQINMIF